MINIHFTRNLIQNNSLLGRDESLKEIPNNDGLLPANAVPPVEFPLTLQSLLVAGNELLPDRTLNTWNKMKSIKLLRFYGEDADTDTENEYSPSSRARRLRIAKKIGISQSQLNFAQLAL
jgi:hypothetical protein